MIDRVLTWYIDGVVSRNGVRQGETYYLEADYEPIALRIYAQDAPYGQALEVDILSDNVSIFGEKACLPAGENSEDAPVDFCKEVLEAGTWISLNVTNQASARNITVSLELRLIPEREDYSVDEELVD